MAARNAGHVATRTTRLCNKLPEEVSLDEIERIHIRGAPLGSRRRRWVPGTSPVRASDRGGGGSSRCARHRRLFHTVWDVNLDSAAARRAGPNVFNDSVHQCVSDCPMLSFFLVRCGHAQRIRASPEGGRQLGPPRAIRRPDRRRAGQDLRGRASGRRDDRPGLKACLKALQPGNTLAVWELDRPGRDLKHRSLSWTNCNRRAWASACSPTP